MLERTFAIGTLLVAVACVMQCWQRPGWWVRDFDFPRLQLAALLCVLLGLELTLLAWDSPWHYLMVAVGAACLAYQLWWILPYTRLFPVEVRWASPNSRQPRLSLLAANVLTPNHGAERLLEQIRQHRPDLLVLLETDDWWDAALRPIEADYPYAIRCPLNNLYGMHVFSRLPLEDPQLCFLIQDDVPSMHAAVRLKDRTTVRLHFLHPTPPSPTENPRSTERDAELLVVGRSVRDSDDPVIVAGDLNDVAWSPTTRLFRKISNLLDPRVGRGMFNTFHAKHWFLRWPLDHIFHSNHFKLVCIRRLAPFGSDHFPIYIELQLTEDGPAQQHALEADAEDHQRARRKMAEKDVTPADVPAPGE